MRPIITDGAWSVGLSVTIMSPSAKTAEPIMMPFGMLTRMVQRTVYSVGSIASHVKGQLWGRGHDRTCPAVDILKATQQGAAPVPDADWDVLDRSAHWRIRLNCPCAAAMRPCQITLTTYLYCYFITVFCVLLNLATLFYYWIECVVFVGNWKSFHVSRELLWLQPKT